MKQTINLYNGTTVETVTAKVMENGNAFFAHRLCWKSDLVGKRLIEKAVGASYEGDIWVFA